MNSITKNKKVEYDIYGIKAITKYIHKIKIRKYVY